MVIQPQSGCDVWERRSCSIYARQSAEIFVHPLWSILPSNTVLGDKWKVAKLEATAYSAKPPSGVKAATRSPGLNSYTSLPAYCYFTT